MGKVQRTKKYFKRRQGRINKRQKVHVGTSPERVVTTAVATSPPPETQGRNERSWTTRALDVVADVLVDYKDLEMEWEANTELAAELWEEGQQQLQQIQQLQQQQQQQQRQQQQQQQQQDRLKKDINRLGRSNSLLRLSIQDLEEEMEREKEDNRLKEDALLVENQQYREELEKVQRRTIALRDDIVKKTRKIADLEQIIYYEGNN